ncbi:hypothetical protein N7457_001112 [Penicillium paradoxum]|uniref:uncharacterized protein n=1 Tax=Penicillium paradoxum TaxID=176176 RepID=UPI002548BED6|nr:uncharacterized protein N7457_001112 [Penicillium paradoxum]KAJ5794513.1 hypothetical protein N7457_001112 [Penicillium paradoxum]
MERLVAQQLEEMEIWGLPPCCMLVASNMWTRNPNTPRNTSCAHSTEWDILHASTPVMVRHNAVSPMVQVAKWLTVTAGSADQRHHHVGGCPACDAHKSGSHGRDALLLQRQQVLARCAEVL